MRFLFILILCSFPLAEGTLLYKLFQSHGAWVVAWVALAALTGVIILKESRFALGSKLSQSFSQGFYSLAALIGSGKTVLAGMLLIFPGFISDVLAFVLLLMPTAELAKQEIPRRERHTRMR
jgi:UPF0716 protein FxsA